MPWPKPIRAEDRKPRIGEKVLGWCVATRQWLPASWHPGAGGWMARGYVMQSIAAWIPMPPDWRDGNDGEQYRLGP